MNKKLLLISFIICCSITNIASAQNEQDILEKYKDEFTTRALSSSNRKAVNGVNDLGEKVIHITYDQVQTNNSSESANIKEIVLTSNGSRITEFTFNYGSEVFFDGADYKKHPEWVKGITVFRLSSQNILNKQGETIFLNNRYEVMVVSSYDTGVLDVHIWADLHISAAVCENIEQITEKYNQAYKTRSIEELSDLRLHLTKNDLGYEQTNEVVLKMVLKEREAIINNILRDYDSYFTIDFDVFVAHPDQIWDQFYIDPIKFIATFCGNSPLLKKSDVIEPIKIGDNWAGGIVFKVDSSGKHGLVCAAKDQGILNWNEAFDRCLDLSLNGYSDWYLPSESELNLMRENIGQGNDLGLSNIGGFGAGYWSSNDYDGASSKAKGLSFSSGVRFEKDKNTLSIVRAIRAF